MQTKQWGARWSELVDVMVKFEVSHLWRPSSLPRSKVRPEEIAMWMKEHRKAGDFEKIQPDFGARMLAWWRDIGPDFRWQPRPEGFPEQGEWPPRPKQGEEPAGAWAMLKSAGDNGLLLVVLALTWWGQSIVSEASGEGLGWAKMRWRQTQSGNICWRTCATR
ncbi:hypothetical protein K438DRAFT_1601776 [Mycena galopus ATCC 62051]|nr:hypothetical protein K438DRAFT_1601776 [Mycena galopus ATCC 62051]